MMVLRLFALALRDGLRLWRLAPVIALIAILPEFSQHVVEVKLGMFASRGAFAELAMNPERLGAALPKVLGMVFAMVFATRYWELAPQGLKWWSPKGIRWGAFLLAGVISSVPLLAGIVPVNETAKAVLSGLLFIATIPTIAYSTGALLGDRDMTLKAAYGSGWLISLRVAIFAAAVFVPLQWLHTQNHYWAMGLPDLPLWGMMVWDSLVVGVIATLMGTAMHHAYRAQGLYADLRPAS
ncbi:MAG: hypothetical protein H6918_06105 [Sphingomonadaceae bacterium]|nr:hypothetical protein [Sphingomonadaceae bacterium]